MLAEKVPADFFKLFGMAGSAQFSAWNLAGILLVSLVQIHGLSHNMGICGSAKNEFAARTGVSGNYLKRVMIILWAFAGLIAVALFGVGGFAEQEREFSHHAIYQRRVSGQSGECGSAEQCYGKRG